MFYTYEEKKLNQRWSTITVYPSGAHEFIPGFKWDSCFSIFSFLCNIL